MEPASTPPPIPPPIPPGTPPPIRRNWWSRNWLWFVPAGCLVFIVIICVFVTTILTVVVGAMKSSDAYKGALSRAKADPRVTRAIGTPIKEGWFVAGSTNVSGGSGKSDLAIPIEGPNGKATIYAVANKFAGEWKYSKLVVKIDKTGDVINLAGKEAGTNDE